MDSFLTNLRKREIPSLYGLRGVAALAVVCSHYSADTKNVWRFFAAGYAVSLFFILSGLLITWLLLREHEKTGNISIPAFYMRRALRIFPVFYAIWIVCLLTTRRFPEKWATFFYMQDYAAALNHPATVLGMAWSLGIEEKFYFLWPTVVKFANRKSLPYVVAALTIAEQTIREWLMYTGHANYAYYAFETNWDCLLIGCFIALLAHRGVCFPRWFANPLIPIVTIIGLYTCNEIVVHYLLALMLIWAVARQPWILNNRVIRYLGLISYSLYLCHLIAERLVWSPLLGDVHFPRWSLQVLSKIIVALICASVLHHSVERPFLKLKDRFHKRASLRVGQMVAS